VRGGGPKDIKLAGCDADLRSTTFDDAAGNSSRVYEKTFLFLHSFHVPAIFRFCFRSFYRTHTMPPQVHSSSSSSAAMPDQCGSRFKVNWNTRAGVNLRRTQFSELDPHIEG